MMSYAALCANEPELAELRAAIRDFLWADRDEFGWSPAVDSWLGRPLSKFQAVQHSLAAMAGDIERARAATTLAIAAAEHGFASAQIDFAVTAAKVTVGRVAYAVTTMAHQLHGAIGVTSEHSLWLATMRAQSWATEYGSPAHCARRLGRLALAAPEPWDVLIGNATS